MGGKPSVLDDAAAVISNSSGGTSVTAAGDSSWLPPPAVPSTGPACSSQQRALFEQWLCDRFPPPTPSDEPSARRFQGLENFGATCYANSVLQALYNTPLRLGLADWAAERAKRKQLKLTEAPTLTALASLFGQMSGCKKRSGVVSPQGMITRLREGAPQFAGPQHQDAQECLIWLLNAIQDELAAEAKARTEEQAREEQTQREKEQRKKGAKTSRTPSLSLKANPPPTIFIPPPQSFLSSNTSFGSVGANSQSQSSSGSPHPSAIGEAPPSPWASPPQGTSAFESLPVGAVGLGGGTLFTASATRPAAQQAPPLGPEAHHSILLQTLHSLQQQTQAQTTRSATPDPAGVASLAAVVPFPSPSSLAPDGPGAAAPPSSPPPSFVQELFEGELTSLTRCLCCSGVSARREAFFDLSLETSPDSSLTSALRAFSSREPLASAEKYACSVCLCKQEAVKSLHVSRYPRVLIAHLKRFRFDEQGRCTKLPHRVSFPFTLALKPDKDTARHAPDGRDRQEPRKIYELTAVVVHIGAGMRHGHYVCLVKVSGQWLCFDDDDVHAWSEEDVRTVFGSQHTADKNGHLDGYLLFYSQTGEEPE